MCLIVLTHRGFDALPVRFWQQALAANPHGFGLMHAADGALCIEKGLAVCAEALVERLERAPRDCPVALHLRAATLGAAGEDNLHPQLARFAGRYELAVMHNGTVGRTRARAGDGPSDTARFTRGWLAAKMRGAPQRWRDCGQFAQALERRAGPNNRFVLMDGTGAWRIFGEALGFWHADMWLSHMRARPWLECSEAKAAAAA